MLTWCQADIIEGELSNPGVKLEEERQWLQDVSYVSSIKIMYCLPVQFLQQHPRQSPLTTVSSISSCNLEILPRALAELK
jgi:hypothetical protein